MGKRWPGEENRVDERNKGGDWNKGTKGWLGFFPKRGFGLCFSNNESLGGFDYKEENRVALFLSCSIKYLGFECVSISFNHKNVQRKLQTPHKTRLFVLKLQYTTIMTAGNNTIVLRDEPNVVAARLFPTRSPWPESVLIEMQDDEMEDADYVDEADSDSSHDSDEAAEDESSDPDSDADENDSDATDDGDMEYSDNGESASDDMDLAEDWDAERSDPAGSDSSLSDEDADTEEDEGFFDDGSDRDGWESDDESLSDDAESDGSVEESLDWFPSVGALGVR